MKSVLALLLASFLVTGLFQVDVDAHGWNGISPFVSTRSEVERLLGDSPIKEADHIVKYVRSGEIVTIRYANTATCRDIGECECLVPDNTVLDISVRSTSFATFSSQHVDKSLLEAIPGAEDVNKTVYFDRTSGVVYVVSNLSDQLIYTQYGPSERQCQDLMHSKNGGTKAAKRLSTKCSDND